MLCDCCTRLDECQDPQDKTSDSPREYVGGMPLSGSARAARAARFAAMLALFLQVISGRP